MFDDSQCYGNRLNTVFSHPFNLYFGFGKIVPRIGHWEH